MPVSYTHLTQTDQITTAIATGTDLLAVNIVETGADGIAQNVVDQALSLIHILRHVRRCPSAQAHP